MNKPGDLASAFLQQIQTPQIIQNRGPINAFNALFAVQDLNEQDARAIERIFVDGYEPGLFAEESVDLDINEIKNITKELKAIKKQEMVLIGERLFKAREIFKKYRERSFRKWIELTFGSFKTGYNYLAFYDLYSELPVDLKERFKEMPAKAAYILASKKASIERKAELVKEHGKDTATNLILLIQETLGDGRRPSLSLAPIDKILLLLEKETSKLLYRKEQLDEGQKQRIRYLVEQLHTIH